MIIGERFGVMQTWAVAGTGDENQQWGGNNDMHIKPLLVSLGSAENLHAELLRSIAENIGVIEGVSDEVLNNKALWGIVVSYHATYGQHIRSHYQQMRDAIAAAKEAMPA
jgi:hypothetical protein